MFSVGAPGRLKVEVVHASGGEKQGEGTEVFTRFRTDFVLDAPLFRAVMPI